MGKNQIKNRVTTRFMKDVSKKFHVAKAILFGSRARGDSLKNSDYDIILVSPDFEGKHFTERASEVLRTLTFHFPMDLLCYTPKEFDEKKSQIGIVRRAVSEGIELT